MSLKYEPSSGQYRSKNYAQRVLHSTGGFGETEEFDIERINNVDDIYSYLRNVLVPAVSPCLPSQPRERGRKRGRERQQGTSPSSATRRPSGLRPLVLLPPQCPRARVLSLSSLLAQA